MIMLMDVLIAFAATLVFQWVNDASEFQALVVFMMNILAFQIWNIARMLKSQHQHRLEAEKDFLFQLRSALGKSKVDP